MRVLTLLDELEMLIEEAKTAPLSASQRVVVDKAQVMNLIEEIRFNLPDVIRQAEQVVNQRARLVAESESEGKAIVQGAQEQAARLVEENEISRRAYAAAEEVLHNAQSNAREVRVGAIAYADDVLGELENVVSSKLEDIRSDRRELKGD